MALYVRNEQGEFVQLTVIKGDKGESAYEQAKKGGYTGTEEEFIAMLNGLTASLSGVAPISVDAEHNTNYDNPHNVTAAQVGALAITGGTLTGKTLYFDNGNARLSGGEDYMQMDVFDNPKDENNRRKLVVNGNKTNLSGAVVLTTKINGENKNYGIYGDHNKPSALDIGAIPAIYSVSSDLDTELQAGGSKMTICSYNSGTKNTPKTQGLTSCAHGMVITNAYTDQYGVQICMPSGDSHMYIRKKDASGINTWAKVSNTSDIPSIPKVSSLGTYTGNGSTGQDNACSLTFEATPKFVVIMAPNASYIGFFLNGVNQYLVASANGFMTSGNVCSWSGKTLSWYSASGGQYYHLNAGTQKYTYYVAY